MGPGGDCDPGAPGLDTITLGFGTYDLLLFNATPVGENLNATGDLDITSEVTIDGQGANQTSIDANSLDRVLHLLGTEPVELRDLKITGGAAPGGGPGATRGRRRERSRRRRHPRWGRRPDPELRRGERQLRGRGWGGRSRGRGR